MDCSLSVLANGIRKPKEPAKVYVWQNIREKTGKKSCEPGGCIFLKGVILAVVVMASGIRVIDFFDREMAKLAYLPLGLLWR